ncbi:zinc finger protein-like, partial [Tropilaelaps mercedesae]
ETDGIIMESDELATEIVGEIMPVPETVAQHQEVIHMDLARDESGLIGSSSGGSGDLEDGHTIGTEVISESIAGSDTVGVDEVQQESDDEDEDVKAGIVLHVHDIKQELPGCGAEEETAVGVSEEVVVDSSRFFLEEDALDTASVDADGGHVMAADDEDDGGIQVPIQHHHLDQVGQQQNLHTRHRSGRSHRGRYNSHVRTYHGSDADLDDEEVTIGGETVEMGEEIGQDVEMAANSLIVASSESRNRSHTRDQASANCRGRQAGSHQHRDGQPHFLGAHRDNLQDEHSFQDQEQAVTSGYSCMECGAVLKSKAAAKKHLIQVHNYQCTSKRKHLRQQQQQQQQQQREIQMQQVQCNAQAATSALALTAGGGPTSLVVGGLDDVQTGLSNIPQIYQCPSCAYSTTRRDKLDKHVMKHVLQDGYHPCGKKRHRPEAPPQRHRHNAEEYHCPYCSYGCTVYKALRKHKKLHLQGKALVGVVKLSCKVCGKDRSSEEEMARHMRKHRQGDNFVCDICGFTSIQLKKIIQHRRMHTGEKPHLCPHCSYRSARRDNLRSHVRRMHKRDNMYIDTFNPSNAADPGVAPA